MSQDFSAPMGARTYPQQPITPDGDEKVAGTARDQASNVAAEASRQAQDLFAQARGELQDQAATQQQRIATGIRSLSTELGSMAERSDQSGTASELVHQASQKAAEIAGWLEEREPGSLLEEVRGFARRRPGMFLAIAAGAGLAAGRLTRAGVDEARDDPDSTGREPAEEPWEGRVRR